MAKLFRTHYQGSVTTKPVAQLMFVPLAEGEVHTQDELYAAHVALDELLRTHWQLPKDIEHPRRGRPMLVSETVTTAADAVRGRK